MTKVPAVPAWNSKSWLVVMNVPCQCNFAAA